MNTQVRQKNAPSRWIKDTGNAIMLIVEDYDAIRALLSRHFEGEGFRVYSASSLIDATHLASAVDPMIVLVDYDLAGTNALEAIQELRAILPHSIIILFGGVDSEVLRQHARAVGATGHLAQGYDLRSLEAMISQANLV